MNPPPTHPDTAIERALVVALLEEHFEAQTSDGPAAEPKRWWPLLAAAVLALGATAVALTWWPTTPAPQSATNKAPDDLQGKPRRPRVSTSLWQPANVAELRQAIGNARRVEARVHAIGNVPVKVADFPDGPLVTILSTPDEMRAFVRALGQSIAVAPVRRSADSPIELQIVLANQKHLRASIEPGALEKRRETNTILTIQGLGAFPASRALAEQVGKASFFKQPKVATLAALGIAIPGSTRTLPSDAKHLRLCGFARKDLTSLARFTAADSVDLRYSASINDAAGLAALRELFPRLRTLRLRGDKLLGTAWRELERFTELRELQVLHPEGSSWGTPKHRSAWTVDDRRVASLRKLQKLESLVIPGSELSDLGLATLAELEQLQRLILSGSPRLRGTGFADFEHHGKLREIHLNGCPKLEDAGLAALGRIRGLKILFLRRARTPVSSATGLAGLAVSKSLERVELDGWFQASVSSPQAFAQLEQAASGSILAADWKRALEQLARIPTLDWLSLGNCPDLVLSDLSFLRGSPIRILNVAGTVGPPPARIAADQDGAVFALPADLETLITE